jgi:tetratricopeptide (TPR) repeat protein
LRARTTRSKDSKIIDILSHYKIDLFPLTDDSAVAICWRKDTFHSFNYIDNNELIEFFHHDIEGAEEWLKERFAEHKALRGLSDDTTLDIAKSQGMLYVTHGKLTEAENILNWALIWHENDDYVNFRKSLTFLNQGKLQEAQKTLDQLWGKLAVGDPLLEEVALFQGHILYQQSKYEEAAERYDHALDDMSELIGNTWGPICPNSITDAIINMFEIQDTIPPSDDWRGPQQFIQKALDLKTAKKNNKTYQTLLGEVLGRVFKVQGNLAQAEPLYREAAIGYEEMLGFDAWLTLRAYRDLAGILLRIGRFDEAAEVLEGVPERCKDVLGSKHGLTIVTNYLQLVISKQTMLWKQLEPRDIVQQLIDHMTTYKCAETLTEMLFVAVVAGHDMVVEQLHKMGLGGVVGDWYAIADAIKLSRKYEHLSIEKKLITLYHDLLHPKVNPQLSLYIDMLMIFRQVHMSSMPRPYDRGILGI